MGIEEKKNNKDVMMRLWFSGIMKWLPFRPPLSRRGVGLNDRLPNTAVTSRALKHSFTPF